MVKSSTPPSAGDDGNIRKRVCKACDRCRLKKSKCDGANPCNRCQGDDNVCNYGVRKKSHDKAYPKGYVEMLEQREKQFRHGLQEMYRLWAVEKKEWSGSLLKESQHGYPLTHDILERMGALKRSPDGSAFHFEEDPDILQARLAHEGNGMMTREISSDGEVISPHSNYSHGSSRSSYPGGLEDSMGALSHSVPRDNMILSMPPSNSRKRPAPGPLETSNYSPGFTGYPGPNGFSYPQSQLTINTGMDNRFVTQPASYEQGFSGNYFTSPNPNSTINPNWMGGREIGGGEYFEDPGFSYGSGMIG